MAAMDVPTEPVESMVPAGMLRKEPAPLPEVSEIEVVRHYTHLSQRNFGVDTGFYPLGSCTMKYNPKLNEDMAVLPGFARIHPLQPENTVQGAIQLFYELERYLAEIAGMARITLQPSAGAHGELTGLMLIKAYHESQGQGHRNLVLIPDNAHGTNPASATLADYKSVEVKTDPATGGIEIGHLQALLESNAANIAAIMMTNPNTLGSSIAKCWRLPGWSTKQVGSSTMMEQTPTPFSASRAPATWASTWYISISTRRAAPPMAAEVQAQAPSASKSTSCPSSPALSPQKAIRATTGRNRG